MLNNVLDIDHLKVKVLAVAVIFLAVLLLNGCAGSGSSGTLVRNRELDNQFQSYQVLPDYTYYFSGGYAKPNAILGIHKDFQLVQGLWQSVEMTPGLLEKWIKTISPEDYKKGGYFAAYIMAPDGRRAGIWYSIQESTPVKFPGDNKIEVYTPDLYQPGERDLPRRGFGRGRF